MQCLCLLTKAKPFASVVFLLLVVAELLIFKLFSVCWHRPSVYAAPPPPSVPLSAACCILRLIIYRWVLLQYLNRFTALWCAAAAVRRGAMRRNAVWFTLHRWLISFCDRPQAQRSVVAVIDSIGQMSSISFARSLSLCVACLSLCHNVIAIMLSSLGRSGKGSCAEGEWHLDGASCH